MARKPRAGDEAAAAFALISILVMNRANAGEKEAMLEALTDCMGGLLAMGRPGAAALVHTIHAGILREIPEDEPPPAPSTA